MRHRDSRQPGWNLLVAAERPIGKALLFIGYIVISIHNPTGRPAEIPPDPNCRGTLWLSFHDADPAQEAASSDGWLTEADAERIWAFVQKHRAGISAIVCHCEQGMSRSATVAQALAEALGVNPRPIVRGRSPNKRVYRLLKNVFARLQQDKA